MTPRLKRFGLGLLTFLVAGVALLWGFIAFLHTGPGERWVSGQLEQALSGPDQGMELDGYHLGWPFRMRADYLRLVDAQGTWLEVVKPELQWHPFRLLRRILHIDRLVAARVEMRRMPVATTATESSTGGLPHIHGTLQLDELSAAIVLDAPVLGQPLALDVGGTFQMQDGGGTVDVHVHSSGGGLARVAGTAGSDYVDLRWYLRIPQLAQWQRLAGVPLAGQAVGSGFIAGRLPSPVVSGRVEMGGGHAHDFAWDALALSGRLVPGVAGVQASLLIEAQAPRWGTAKPPVAAASLGVVGDIAPASGRIRLGHMRLEGGGNGLVGSGIMEQWGQNAVLRFSGDMADLSLLGVPGLTGGATLHGQIMGNLLQPALRGRAQLDTHHFASGLALLDRLGGDHPQIRADFHYDQGRMVLDDAVLRGDKARIWAAGPVGERLNLWAKLTLPDLAVVTPTLTGAGVAQGRVFGPISDPAATGMVRSHGLTLAGMAASDGVLAFDFAHLAKPQGQISAAVSMAGYPVSGQARLRWESELHLDDVVLASGQSRLAGDLVVSGGGLRGHLNGRIPQVQDWQGLLNSPVTGGIAADAVLDPAQGQSVQLNVRGQDLTGFGVSVATLSTEARLTHLTTTPSGTITVAAAQVGRDALILDRLTAQGNGTARDFAFSLDGSGAGARLEAAGSAQVNGAAGTAGLDRLQLAMGGRNASLARPSQIRWTKDGMVLAPSAFTLGAGRLDVDGSMAGQMVRLRARLDEVPLDMVDAVLPDTHAIGRISGTASLDGPLNDPRARVELTGQNVGFAAAARAGLGRLSTRLVADWQKGRVTVQASAQDGDRVQAAVRGVLPLPGDGEVVGQFSLSGDAGRISEALPLAGHVFAGHLNVEGRVAGTMAAPLLSGQGRLSDGRYENLENGTLVTALSATAHWDGDRVQVQIQGGDGGQGTMRAEGTAGLDGTYGGNVVLNRFTALRRDDVEAEVDGTLRLEGAGSQGRLAGALVVPRADMDIARLKGSGPVSLDVVEINRPGAKASKPVKPTGEAAPVTIALAVAVKVEHAFVRGRGLDSEWQGDVTAAGTLAQPSLTGRVAPVRGEYSVLGKVFRLTPDSEVVFQGGDTIDPSLNVIGEAKAEEITARITITGTANHPDIAMTSQPPLPQDEVLARVLFGREAGKLSVFQQVQLAQLAASGLTGGGGGFDPIGQVRGFLGLDVLGIGSSDAPVNAKPGPGNTGPTLSAGKYIGSDTFVRVDQGTSGLGKVTVEQELGGGFSVESSVGEQSGGGVGFNWRKDY